MRVVSPSDGFNLYRGGLELAGAQPGWKRALAQTLAGDLDLLSGSKTQ